MCGYMYALDYYICLYTLFLFNNFGFISHRMEWNLAFKLEVL